MDKIITIPFGYILDWLYQFTSNYGIALLLFSVVVQAVMMPINAKSKKSMMKMSRLQPRIQEIQRKYADDKQKQQEAIQALQKEEGASMGCGGCLWSLIPLLILLPLYQVVRQPIQFMLHESAEVAAQIVEVVKNANLAEIEAMKEAGKSAAEIAAATLFGENNYYDQIVAISNIGRYAEAVKAAVPEVSARTLEGLNLSFLGINLGAIPTFNIFDSANWAWDWAHIGAFLVPIFSAGQQVISMLVAQRSNNSVVTDEKGLQDKETAKNSQANQTNKMMLWMMPAMSLWIGFTVPTALSLYWFVGGVVRMVEDMVLTKHYRKVYDAEDAVRLQKYMEQQAIEEEKERIRAERRAANPDGITENTSKKKLQKKQQRSEEEARAAAKKEYDARKGIAEEEESVEKETLSGVADRPYCKGRNYDPNRYSNHNTEE